MNRRSDPIGCDQGLVDALVRGDVMDDQQSNELSRHLDHCSHCCHLVQEVSRGVDDQTRELLQPQPFDEPSDLYARDSELTGVESLLESSSVSLSIRNVLDSLTPTDDPEMLGRLGVYEVSGVVGAGGMGVVVKAFDRSLDRTVAIKVLAPHLASSGAARQRFAREAKAAAAVLHPNVVAIHGVSQGQDGKSLPYLVMPYLRGSSLQRRIDSEGPLSTVEILRISVQIAEGLAAAHSQGLVHRDIKPANILLEEGIERVSITDFGLARTVDDATLTHSGVIAGTPQYMSPEQARGETTDARSDLFSLGSLIYTMCTGRAPFRAETSYGILRRITDDSPRPIRQVNSDIPAWLCRLVERLHEKNPEDRYPTASSVAKTLHQCLAHVQTPEAKLPRELRRSPWQMMRNRGAVVMLGLAVLLLVVPATWTAWSPSTPQAGQTNGPPSQDRSSSDPPREPLNDTENSAIDTQWEDRADPSLESIRSLIETLEQDTRRPFHESL